MDVHETILATSQAYYFWRDEQRSELTSCFLGQGRTGMENAEGADKLLKVNDIIALGVKNIEHLQPIPVKPYFESRLSKQGPASLFWKLQHDARLELSVHAESSMLISVHHQ